MTRSHTLDPRCNSTRRIQAPHPLPHVSRRALRRVKDWMAPPSSCPYCEGRVTLTTNNEVYGRLCGDWPYVYLCRVCDAYVGLHPDTDLPLGTLADRQLREARKRAKGLWQVISRARNWSRDQAYQWLAQAMGISRRECHFGHFDLDRAQQALKVCEEALLAGMSRPCVTSPGRRAS